MPFELSELRINRVQINRSRPVSAKLYISWLYALDFYFMP